MSYTDPSREDIIEMMEARNKRMWPAWKWAIVLSVAVPSVYLMLPERKPFMNPKIKAEAYVWPAGCEKRKYKGYDDGKFDKISRNCLVDQYYIGNGQQWGWSNGGNRPYFYRVGNDAIRVSSTWSSETNIYETITNVFIVEGQNND